MPGPLLAVLAQAEALAFAQKRLWWARLCRQPPRAAIQSHLGFPARLWGRGTLDVTQMSCFVVKCSHVAAPCRLESPP